MMILVRKLNYIEKNFLEYFKTNYWYILKPIIGLFLNQLLIWIESKFCSCFGVDFKGLYGLGLRVQGFCFWA